VAIALLLTGAFATKIADMDQGAEFTKCFKIDDWNTKTADDDLELGDRDANGCCAEGYVPGVPLYASYFGAQVVCAVEDDGSIGSYSSSSSNDVKTCDYKKCYVMKIADKILCTDDAVALLNGCCGATKDSRTFKSDCMHYDYTHSSATAGASADPEYCLTYHKNYGTIGYSGTNDATDDVADGKFQVDKFYAYAPCAGGGGSSDDDTGGTASANTVNSCNVGTKTVYTGCGAFTDTDTFAETACAAGWGYDKCLTIAYSSTASGCTTSVAIGYCSYAAADCTYYDSTYKENALYESYTCTDCAEDNCNTKETAGGGGGDEVDHACKWSVQTAMLMLILASMATWRV